MPQIHDITPGDPMETQIKKRLVAIACEAIAAALGKACSGFPYEGADMAPDFPYAVSHTGPEIRTQDANSSQVMQLDQTYLVDIITSHATTGYRGVSSILFDEVRGPIGDAFDCQSAGKILQSVQFPTPFRYINGNIVIYLRGFGLRYTGNTGLVEIRRGIGGVAQWGGRFTIEIQLEKDVGGL